METRFVRPILVRLVAAATAHGPRTAERALVFKRSFPLQAIGFCVLTDRPRDEVNRAVDYAERRIREESTT